MVVYPPCPVETPLFPAGKRDFLPIAQDEAGPAARVDGPKPDQPRPRVLAGAIHRCLRLLHGPAASGLLPTTPPVEQHHRSVAAAPRTKTPVEQVGRIFHFRDDKKPVKKAAGSSFAIGTSKE